MTEVAATGLPEVTISESAGVRYLHLGTPWVQGAMRIDEPLEIELDEHDAVSVHARRATSAD